MKGKVLIVTYFYWSNEDRKHHSFEVYNSNNWTLDEVIDDCELKLEDKDIHGYYITEETILASNI